MAAILHSCPFSVIALVTNLVNGIVKALYPHKLSTWTSQDILAGRLISFILSRRHRHCENFWAFTRPRRDFDLILLISNMITVHRGFTGPTYLLSSSVAISIIEVFVSIISINIEFLA